MKHQFAAVHELARIEMLAGLPGEILGKLAEQTERRALEPGEAISDGDDGGVYLVLSGMLSGGTGGPFRPGDSIRGTALAGTPVRAVTPAVVARSDGAAFDELVSQATTGH